MVWAGGHTAVVVVAGGVAAVVEEVEVRRWEWTYSTVKANSQLQR